MNKRFEKLNQILILVVLLLALILIMLALIVQMDVILASFIFIVMTVLVSFAYLKMYRISESSMLEIEGLVEAGLKETYEFSEVMTLTFDDDYNITWMSSLFKKRNLDHTGSKLLEWLPEVLAIINGESDEIEIQLDEKYYKIIKIDNSPQLIFNDISKEVRLNDLYKKEQQVIGLIHFDNYEESTFYQDEQTISMINTSVKQPVLDWCLANGIIVKSLRNYRLFVVLNEAIYEKLLHERFDILNKVRNASKEIETPITLSMSFAKGSDDLKVLDQEATNLLDLALTRGGDQVAVRTIGKDVKYYGGSTLAVEKRSKVRVRIMAHTLRELISKSSNVILCGHKEADADCIGSMLAVSRICRSLKVDTYCITKTGGIESMIKNVLDGYKEELNERHNFVTINEAENQLDENSLVIMVDHHNYHQSNGEILIPKAKKIAIIDHHRRAADLGIDPMYVYVETSASSTTELVTEFFPYFDKKVAINSMEANIMYLGIKIDTNNFKIRTGARTFNVLASLRNYGASPIECNNLAKEPFEIFKNRNELINSAINYNDEILIAKAMNDKVYHRKTISQAADELLEVKGIEAVFVITNIDSQEIGISARSQGEYNVQLVMEKLGGGGHLNAAATQVKKTSIDEMYDKLVDVLNENENLEV